VSIDVAFVHLATGWGGRGEWGWNLRSDAILKTVSVKFFFDLPERAGREIGAEREGRMISMM
jgi:hypothetical protein